MKRKDVTPDWFARMSFENDKTLGNWRGEKNSKGVRIRQWDDLDEEYKKLYLVEANYYIKTQPNNWPLDIIKRLES